MPSKSSPMMAPLYIWFRWNCTTPGLLMKETIVKMVTNTAYSAKALSSSASYR